MPVVATHADIARELGITRQRVGQLAKKPGFPVMPDGRFDTEEVQKFRDISCRQKPTNSKPRTAEDQKQADDDREVLRRENLAKARGRELDNEERELNLAKKRGDLWPRTLCTELIAIIFARLRNTVNGLQRAGNVTGAIKVSEDLEIAERQIRERLAKEKK